MEILITLTVIALIIYAIKNRSKDSKIIEDNDLSVAQSEEKKVVFIKRDKSSILKYSILFIVFSCCARFIIFPAIPTTFIVKTEFSNSSDLRIRHDLGYNNHIKIDHDWPSYNTLKVENKNK